MCDTEPTPKSFTNPEDRDGDGQGREAGESREHCTRWKDSRSAEEALPGVPPPRGLSDEVTAVNSVTWRVPPMLGSSASMSAGHSASGSSHALPAAASLPPLPASQAPAQLSSPRSYTGVGRLPTLVFAFRVSSALPSQLWTRALSTGDAATAAPRAVLRRKGPSSSHAQGHVPALPHEALQAEAALARKRGKRERVSLPSPPV